MLLYSVLLTAKWVALSTVYPSAGDFATASFAMFPPAPGRFSATTATPSSFASSSAATRVRKSPEPPGG